MAGLVPLLNGCCPNWCARQAYPPAAAELYEPGGRVGRRRVDYLLAGIFFSETGTGPLALRRDD